MSEDSLNGGPFNLREAWLQNSVMRFATLSTADLQGADMSGADLMHARLDQANLSNANLSNARLDHARLCGALLKKVNLRGTSLRFADLSTTDLQAGDMSDADLTHARLGQANLSDANFTNARLDYADFAGAKLSKVNLCGASLQHARNLRESQIRESMGNPTTVLPPHLQGCVSWSPAINPTIERQDPRPPPRVTANVHGRHINSYNVQRWGVAAFLSSVALTITVFVWPPTNEVAPHDTLGEQKRSDQLLTETNSSLDASDQSLRAITPGPLTKKKATSEQQLTADPTAGTGPVDQTDGVPEQNLATEMNEETVLRETGAPTALQAGNNAEQSTTAVGPSQSTPDGLNEEYEAPESPSLVFVETPPTAWPHAIVPEASEPSTLVHAGSGQTPFSFGAEIPPTLPARNPERGQDVETAQTASPSNAELPPQPLRNPLGLGLGGATTVD